MADEPNKSEAPRKDSASPNQPKPDMGMTFPAQERRSSPRLSTTSRTVR